MCEPHPPCATFSAPLIPRLTAWGGCVAQDGDSHFGPQVEILQVMYYPQATPDESGPTCVQPLSSRLSPFWTPRKQLTISHSPPSFLQWTLNPLHQFREVVAGSHFMPISEHVPIEESAGRTMSSPAGTIFLTHYSILHRRAEATAEPTTRNMLK